MRDFFLHISQLLLDDNNVKMTNFTFVEDGNTRQQLSLSFPELLFSPSEFDSQKFANIQRKSPPTWLVSASYSAWHFFTDGVF